MDVKKNIVLIQSFNSFILFTKVLDFLSFCKTLLTKFFILRGIDFYKKDQIFNNIKNGFTYSNWFLSYFKNRFLFYPKRIFIQNYKKKLKSILKSNPKNINFVLNLFNHEIGIFSELFFVSNDFHYFVLGLDFYIQKLLWRYLKRIYAKRSNIWIYNKFWRFINGVWQFFIFDKGKNVTFLKSHFYPYLQKELKHFNFAMDLFDYKNKRKFFNDLKFEFGLNKSQSTKFIYYRQLGLCFICKRPLLNEKIKFINLNKVLANYKSKAFLYNVYILHFDCNI